MLVIAPSATPPQLDSVGECVTRMPNSVAASTSTSSTPIVYLATMRRLFELCMIFCVIGVLRIDVPTSASAPSDICAISSSLSPCGVSQFRSDDAKALRALHDLLRNRRAANRRADERVGAFGHLRHLELAVALRRVPVRLALLQLAARGLEYPVALARRVGGRENEDLRLCHAELLSSEDAIDSLRTYKPPLRQVNRLPVCAPRASTDKNSGVLLYEIDAKTGLAKFLHRRRAAREHDFSLPVSQAGSRHLCVAG